jgi:hypothetical protein
VTFLTDRHQALPYLDPIPMRTLRTALVVFLLVPSLYATTYVVPTDRDMIAAAPAIVRGTVIDTYSRRAPDGTIETVTEVLVEERLKGGGDARTIEIVQWGGHLGNEWMAQSDAPVFARGERLLLFLERSRTGDWTTYSVGLGAFRFERDAYGEPLVRRTSISGWSEDGEEHVEQARREKPFLDYIRELTSGGSATPDYFANEAVSMRRIVTNDAFVAGGYTFPFVGSTPSRRRDDNLNIAWRPIGTQGGLNLDAAIDFGNGQWNGQSPKISYSRGATATGNTRAADAEHRVIGNDPNSDIAGSFGGSGVVATAYSFGSSTFTFNGETFQSITHSDIVVQDGVSSGNISVSVFNVVMTHELGHTLGLRHSNQAQNGSSACAAPLDCCINTGAGGNCRAIMLSSAVSLAGLQTWDRNAIDCLYDGVCAESAACTPPSISTQPQNRSITAGATTNLSVSAAGSGPFTYQWLVAVGDAWTPIGSNSSTLSGLSPSSTTSYFVRVTGQCGPIVDSNIATITVTSCANVIVQSANAMTGTGSSVTLAAAAIGGTGITYTWFRGDTPGVGGRQIGTGTPLLTTIASTTNFWVRARNSCGNSSVSNRLTVAECTPPSITMQPQPQTTSRAGETVTLALIATGTPTLTYAWFCGELGDTSASVGTNAADFTTDKLLQDTTFWVRVMNGCGMVDSAAAVVKVPLSRRRAVR